MKPRKPLALLASVLALGLASQAQTTIHVPADKPTIQAAIDGSTNGDTVLVAPGTYYENINFHGHNITVTSSAGAATTIIDGRALNSVVTITSGEARTAVLSGFTLQNGRPAGPLPAGGGVFIGGSSPTLSKNVITRNACNGVVSFTSAPLITGNTISATQASTASCGNSGVPVLLMLESTLGGVTELQDNVITGNAAATGAAVYATNLGDVLISRNTIQDNSVPGNTGGTGIYLYSNRFATVVNNLVQNNFTTARSGNGNGIFGDILRSTAQTFYGLPQLALLNNTIRNNGPAGNTGPQISLYEPGPRFQVANNVLAGTSPALLCYVTATRPQPGVENNVSTGYSTYCNANANSTDKDVTDPMLSSAGVPLAGSPAIDAGNNSVLPQFPLDVAGVARAQSTQSPVVIDAGALEAAGTVSTPQSRIVIAPLRYEVSAGTSTDISVALTSSDLSSTQTTQATLYMDGNAVQTAMLAANNSAVFASVTIPSGQHTLYATGAAAGGLPAARSVTVAVNGVSAASSGATASPASHVVMQVDPVAQLGGQLSTQFRCFLSDGTANGTMRQYDNGILKVQTALTGAAVANATYFGDPGPHIYECEYQDAGRSSSTVAAQALVPASSTPVPSLQLFSLPDPSEYGDPVSIGGSVAPYTANLSGHVRITEGTTVILDQAVDSSGLASVVRSDLSPGVHTFAGTITTTSPSTSTVFTQTVHFAPTFLTLSASPTSALSTAAVSISTTASSSYKGQSIPGSLQLLDGSTVLSTAVPFNGAFTLPPGTFTTGGAHILTVAYPGSPIFAPATSSAVTVTITVPPPPPPPDFSIDPTTPSLTLRTEYHGSTTLTLAAINGFSGPVHIACGNLPRVATCTFDHDTYALASTAPVLLSIETSAIPGFKSLLVPLGSAGGFACALTLPLFGLRRRRRILPFATLLIFAAFLSSCSSKYPDHTPPGTYTVTLTATGNSSGTAITHTVPFTLTVTP